ncbi:MAG: cupredoxin domain-containing protein [Ferrovum sp.]|jgi:plastocyanin|nr:cupredoxin domain-containing protein [Ferrovum sp.]
MKKICFWLLAGGVGISAINLGWSADAPEAVEVNVINHEFSPSVIHLKAGVETPIIVHNQDLLPIEFESTELSREVVVVGHRTAHFTLGPVEAGEYHFFNDLNHSMKGTIVVTKDAGGK